MAGRYDQKKPKQPGAPESEQEQEQEQEVEQEKKPETSRAQGQMGNAALAAMLNNRGLEGFSGEGGGGAGHSVRRRSETESGDIDYGGDDDIVDDVPLTLDDLTRSWNPTTKKSDDRPRFVEPMPDDDLPPEDAEWLAAAHALPRTGGLPRISTIDALLQPSAEVLAASISGWARATGRWVAPEPGARAVAWLAAVGAPLLQSPDARVLPARAAIAALGTCILADSPAIRAAPSIETGALVEFCLEIEGRSHRVDNLVSELADAAAKLPRAAKLLAAHVPEKGGRTTPRELPGPAHDAVLASLRTLSRWTPLEDALEPMSAAQVPERDPNDPLGLDAILTEMTGGPVDVDDAVHARALQTAERLAGEASRTRIAWVAVASLVDEVARLWTPSTSHVLGPAAVQLDTEIDEALRLLLEVARASQKRTYGPRALSNGLRRAARRIDGIRDAALAGLAAVVGGILPGVPEVEPMPPVPHDALWDARYAGAPLEALDWVAAHPDSSSRDLAHAALRVVSGASPADLVAPLTALRDRARVGTPTQTGTVATILLAHAHLHLGDHAEAVSLGADIQAAGRARRNGMLVAEGALVAVEAHVARGEATEAAATRLRAGRLCIDLDARGAVSLLARWQPPTDDDADYSPFFDYPMDVEDEPPPS